MKNGFVIKKIVIKGNNIDLFGEIIAYVLLLFCINPKSNSKNLTIYIFILTLWYLLISLNYLHILKKILFSKYIALNLLWPFYLVILSIIGNANISNAIWHFSMIATILFFYIYYQIGYVSTIKRLLTICLLYMFIININSIYVLFQNPNAARLMASSNTELTKEYASAFFSNYNYVYSITLLSISLIGILIFIKNDRKLKVKISILLLEISSITLIFRAQYSFAILFILIFSVMMFFKPPKNKVKRVLYYMFITLMVFIVGIFGSNIIYSIAEYFGNDTSIGSRFFELANFLSGNKVTVGSDGHARLSLYMKSLSTWLNHFLLGVGGKSYTAGGQVGGHSQILDIFAYYGVIGGGLFLFLLYNNWRLISNKLCNTGKHIYILVTFLYISQLIINTGYNQSDIVFIYIVIPFLLLFIFKDYNAKS